jgi:hypothetical protein
VEVVFGVRSEEEPREMEAARNEKKLEAFIKWASKAKVNAEYERRMAAALETDLSDLDLGTFLTAAQRE